ncbi:putative RNA recognition motif domain, nucleotide-binding alpha-beta plait domain superfamily [Helianthus debilis subsp. tardiflorus]
MERRRRKPIPENVQRRILKIFVSNIPEGCSGNDLASHARVFGDIFDLYIARKRDKGGNRFGFISFLDIKDKEELLRNLKTIRLGGYKLWFNIARFVLEDGEINNHGEERSKAHEYSAEVRPPSVERIGTSRIGSQTFKDLFVGKTITVGNEVKGFHSLHGIAVAARMIDLAVLKNIKIILKTMGFKQVRVQYMSGLDVLITFPNTETTTRFKEAALVKPDAFAYVALRCVVGRSSVGSKEVMDSLGGLFGRVVHGALCTENDLDLSYVYVGILVGDGKRISEEVQLKWNNRKFRIWITEELGEWMPDFLEPEDDNEEEEESTDGDFTTSPQPQDTSMEAEELPMVEEIPVVPVQPENVSATGDVSLERDENFGENIGMVNDDINDLVNIPIIDSEVVSEINKEDFVPGVDFQFEKDFQDTGPHSVCNISKRKKFKNTEVGRPSIFYTSSNESLKETKRARNVEDAFGLDSLLGLKENNLNQMGGGSDTIEVEEELRPFDLNPQPETRVPFSTPGADSASRDQRMEERQEVDAEEADQ